MIRGLALCAGIGGIELGLHRVFGNSYRTVCYVEREAFAAAVLVARMADSSLDEAPIWDDLTTFDGYPWRGKVDLLSAGYPCQPFSHAGRRKGTDDPRHLWPHIARVIRECGPGLVFLENVPGHLSLGFEEVVQELEGLDYEVAACLTRASDAGSPHRRERLFVLARSIGERGTRWGRTFELVSKERNPESDSQERKRSGGAFDYSVSPLGHPASFTEREPNDKERPDTRERTWLDVSGTIGGMGYPHFSGLQGRSLSGCERRGEWLAWPPGPDGDWSDIPVESQPSLCRVAHGIPFRVDRLQALGNAVVPAQAEFAFRHLWNTLLGSKL